MKIGVSSYSFQTLLKRGMTYFEACQHARDMGYDGIEFIDLDLAFAPGEDNVESLAKHLRAHCEALDLDIPAYTAAAARRRTSLPVCAAARISPRCWVPRCCGTMRSGG